MTKKKNVQLHWLQTKLGGMQNVLESIIAGLGHWDDGTGKDKLVYQADKAEVSDTAVVMKEQYGSFKFFIKGEYFGKKKLLLVTDEEFVALMKEGVKKVKEQKGKEKEKRDIERQKNSKIGYMDVFKRVADFLKKNGYSITTPKDETSPISMMVGTVNIRWNNLKDFVSAGFGEHGNWDREGYISIFNVIDYWATKYYKLVYPSLRKLVNKVQVLREVDKHAKVPVAVMDELDRLGIGALGSETRR